MDSNKKYKCIIEGCKASFLRPSRLLWHMRNHTGEKPYKCKINNCDKAYTNSSHLKRHIKVHVDISENFQCPICSKLLSNVTNLKRHVKVIHDNDKPMRCKDCHKQFRNKELFNIHCATHKNKIFQIECKECNETFTSYRKFKRHRDAHNSSNFTCAKCKTNYDEREIYYTHLQNEHKDDHVCDSCNKFFLRPFFLKNHECDDAKVFICNYVGCNRIYSYAKNLENHVKVAHLGKRFKCDICNKQYKSKKQIKFHITNIHLNMNVKTMPESKNIKCKTRKNKGVPKRSMISRLTGYIFPKEIEKMLLNRDLIDN